MIKINRLQQRQQPARPAVAHEQRRVVGAAVRQQTAAVRRTHAQAAAVRGARWVRCSQKEKDENSIPGIDDYHLQFNAPELIDYVKELCSVVTSELQNMADKKKEKAIKDDLEFLEGLNEDILKDAETEEERQLMIDVQQEIEEMKKPDYDGLDKVMVSPEMLDNLTEIMLSPSKNYSAEEHEEDLNLFFGWAIRYNYFKSFTLDDVLKRYSISKDVLQKRGIYDDFIFAWDIYR